LPVCGAENASGDGRAVDDERHRHAPLRNTHDKLAGPVDRVDDPHPGAVEAARIVGSLFRQPALAFAGQRDPEGLVDSDVGRRQWIVSVLHLRRDLARRERLQSLHRQIKRVVDTV
jgi:hypothetical protein